MNVENLAVAEITEVMNGLKKSGKFFSVDFIKKDGSFRRMICRFGVTSYQTTGKPSTTAHIEKYCTVFDLQKMQYRNINKETMKAINMAGKRYVIA